MAGFLIMLGLALGVFAALVIAYYSSANWRRERRIRIDRRHRRHRR